MDGPPSKRPRRDAYDASHSRADRDTLSPAPRSPAQPVNGHGRHDDERGNIRRRSRSPRDSKHGRRDRSRSREPRRDKDRSYRDRSRERIRDRDGDKDRDRSGRNGRPQDRGADKSRRYSQSRSRSRSPRRKTVGSNAMRSAPGQSNVSRPETNGTAVKREDRDMDLDGDDGGSEAEMRRMMGFATFKSTKNTKVPGNQIYGVRKEKKAKYRQYMNRVGGFNRPLSPSR